MSPDNRTGSRMGPLPRRARCLVGSAIASLALVLAAGVVSPVAAEAQSTGERESASSSPGGGGDKCKDGPYRGGDKVKCENVGASIFATTNQVFTQVPDRVRFDGAVYDTDAMFDDASDTLVVRTAGRYLLKGRILWTVRPSQDFILLLIRVNGQNIAVDSQRQPGLDSLISQEVSTIVPLKVGDRISLHAGGAGATSTSTTAGGPYFVAPQLQAEWQAP